MSIYEDALTDTQVEKMDCVVNDICDGVKYTPEELAYLLSQLIELNRRGDF